MMVTSWWKSPRYGSVQLYSLFASFLLGHQPGKCVEYAANEMFSHVKRISGLFISQYISLGLLPNEVHLPTLTKITTLNVGSCCFVIGECV